MACLPRSSCLVLQARSALERYRDLLAAQVVATLNAALCARHLARCPPSAELRVTCHNAAALEAAVDAALGEVEAGGFSVGDGGGAAAGRVCADRHPAAECAALAAARECSADPAFMHVMCR